MEATTITTTSNGPNHTAALHLWHLAGQRTVGWGMVRTCAHLHCWWKFEQFCHIEQKLHRTRYRPSIETLNLKDVDHGHFLLFSPIQVHQQHPATIHPILAVYGFMPYHGEEQLQLLWSLWQARHLWDGPMVVEVLSQSNMSKRF